MLWQRKTRSSEHLPLSRTDLNAPQLQFKVATDGEHLTRAKRSTIEILETLRWLNCFSPGLFFKLFDAQIVPSLSFRALSPMTLWKKCTYKLVNLC